MFGVDWVAAIDSLFRVCSTTSSLDRSLECDLNEPWLGFAVKVRWCVNIGRYRL